MIDSHSFNWAASSIARKFNGSMAMKCSLKDLDAVENISEDVWKQNSAIDRMFKEVGRLTLDRELLRDFKMERHSFLF